MFFPHTSKKGQGTFSFVEVLVLQHPRRTVGVTSLKKLVVDRSQSLLSRSIALPHRNVTFSTLLRRVRFIGQLREDCTSTSARRCRSRIIVSSGFTRDRFLSVSGCRDYVFVRCHNFSEKYVVAWFHELHDASNGSRLSLSLRISIASNGFVPCYRINRLKFFFQGSIIKEQLLNSIRCRSIPRQNLLAEN